MVNTAEKITLARRIIRSFETSVVASSAFRFVEVPRSPIVIPQPVLEKQKVTFLPAPEINHSRQDFQGVELRQKTLEQENESKDAWLKQVQADALLSYSLRREAIANECYH